MKSSKPVIPRVASPKSAIRNPQSAILSGLDKKYLWHPFTQMQDWLKSDPIVIVKGKGSVVWDAEGNEYLDANSSIWVNLHGHAHPKINSAIQAQLKKISHSSALGFANEPASILGERLIKMVNSGVSSRSGAKKMRNPQLERVFYSDDGSTAMEVALKLDYAFWRRSGVKSPGFLSLDSAYHGDTVGAVSVGHCDLFHKAYSGLLFKSDKVMSPYCYRCPFNRAKPERADARDYRKCKWECVGLVEEKFNAQKKTGNPYSGFVFEPLMQGAAGMIPQPEGWLKRVSEIGRFNGAHLLADEVMTGFGRTGSLFASHQEGVQPDFISVAKGLTGGYLPMAATFTTGEVFDSFLGKYEEFKSFFHGHSFTANQLGSAAALASLDLLQAPACQQARQVLEETLKEEFKALWSLPNVGDVRQVGLVAGIELVKNWQTREPFSLKERVGFRVCDAMAQRGVLTRPVGSVIVILPPYSTTKSQAKKIVQALAESIEEVMKTAAA